MLGGSPAPLLSRAWVIACVVASLFVTDYAVRLYHRPRCVDACAGAGHDLESVSTGRRLLDRQIRCDCAGGARVRLYQSWSEYFDGIAGTVLVSCALLGVVALARAFGRERRGRASG